MSYQNPPWQALIAGRASNIAGNFLKKFGEDWKIRNDRANQHKSQQQKGAQNTPPQNIQHAEASGSDALSQMISNLVKDNPSLLTSTDVNALITASRNTDTQGMCLNNTDSIHQGSHEVLELPVPNHLKTVPQEASFFANSQRLAQHNKNSHGDSGPLKKRLKMSP